MGQTRAQLRRLYWIDAALQRAGHPNAAGLARDLGVSSGTIHRDLQVLRSKFRAPLSFDPTQRGYAYGRPFRPDLPDLSAEEAIDLARGLLRRGEIGESALGECLLRFLQQLSRLLPEGRRPGPSEGLPPEALARLDAALPSRTAAGKAAGASRPGRVRPASGKARAGKAGSGSAGTKRPAETGPVTILLRFDRAVTREVLQAGLFRRGEVQLLTNGGFEATVAAEDPDGFLLDLLRWAPHFEIAGPPWVRRRLPQLLRRLLKQTESRKRRRRRG